jgi:hypothetical protein
MKNLYLVCYKSSGIVANKFSNLGDARYWIQQNDTLFTGENGYEPKSNVGMYEIKKQDGKVVK